jgi:glycosyltransferase involved in cell wall biosynthesis
MQASVGIVVASSNTRHLIAHVLYSLYRLMGRDQFSELVVVDNASTDGSLELLEALQEAGLVHLLRNERQEYHGPALTRGVSSLAERVEYVWVLDSDVVVLRADTVRDALRVLCDSGAAAVGQKVGDPTYDAMLRRNKEMLHPCSLLLDPALIWKPPIPPFVEDGAPATAMQIAADEQGLKLVAFPFVEERYIVHLGRGTLREVAEGRDVDNRYYDWALGHRDYHYAGDPDGARLYAEFCQRFDGEVGELTPANLVDVLV